MGKNIRKQAEELGFTNFPLTVLFARPRTFRPIFTRLVPDVADIIRDYFKSIDPNFVQGRSGGGRNNSYYYLAPQARIYAEVFDRMVGFNVNVPENHLNEILIFSKYKAHLLNIVWRLEGIFPGGMLAHLDFIKIEKKFNVKKEDYISTWNTLLDQCEIIKKPTAEYLQELEAERKEFDRELDLIEMDELDSAKKFRKTLDKYRD